MWTTSILGAGEAGIRYGVSGGWAYSIGATVGFSFFIPIILRIRRNHGDARTLTSFILKRYGRHSRDLFYVFSITVVIYIVIEQAVGVGTILHACFGMSFRLAAFLVVTVIAVGVAYGGLSCVVFFDLLSFFIFSVIFILICVRILPGVDWADIVGARPEQSARFFTAGGARYALTAVFVAAGQVYLDPGYYAKAMAARDGRVLRRGFLFGGSSPGFPFRFSAPSSSVSIRSRSSPRNPEPSTIRSST
jgi:Na+/proline symporter